MLHAKDWKRLKEQFIEGVRAFVFGDGWVWPGEFMLRFRGGPEYSDIHLIIVIPFDGHDKDWDAYIEDGWHS